MSRGEQPRILVLGPLGLQPWVTRTELIAHLEALGHDVRDNDTEAIVPTLDPMPPRLGRLAASAPALAWWSARMLWRWRRNARRGLRNAGIERVLVWDPVWAGLIRSARPRHVEVAWVHDGSAARGVEERALRRWLQSVRVEAADIASV